VKLEQELRCRRLRRHCSRENIGNGRRAPLGLVLRLVLNTLIDAEIDGTPNRFQFRCRKTMSSSRRAQRRSNRCFASARERWRALGAHPVFPLVAHKAWPFLQELRIVVPDILYVPNGVERARRIFSLFSAHVALAHPLFLRTDPPRRERAKRLVARDEMRANMVPSSISRENIPN
jgi:hypothetical protein